jgi:hypothetical protein
MRAKTALSLIWQASSTNYLPHYSKVDVEVKYMKYCVLFLSTHSFDFLSQLGLDIGSAQQSSEANLYSIPSKGPDSGTRRQAKLLS